MYEHVINTITNEGMIFISEFRIGWILKRSTIRRGGMDCCSD